MDRREMTKDPNRRMRRRGLATRLGILVAVFALIAAACGDDDAPATTAATTAAPTTAGATTAPTMAPVSAPEIPASSVNMAIYPCCADQSHYQIALVEGMFDDVNMSVDNDAFHLYTEFGQIIPSMQRGDFDVAGIFVQGYLNTLDTFGMDIPPIFFTDSYVGYAILKAPDSDAKTAQDFVDEGMSFGDAAAAAVQQLRGKEVFTPPHGQTQPPYPDVFLSYGGMSYPEDLDLQFLEDVKIVEVSAQPGRIEFAIPYAAPVLVQMLRNGWEPIINTVQTIADAGSEQSKRMILQIGSSGLFAQRTWVEEDHDRALRLLSVMFRMMNYLQDPATQQRGWEIQTNMMNAERGLELIPDDVRVIWESIDPMWTYEDQDQALWNDPTAGNHVETALAAQIGELINTGTLEGPLEKYDIQKFLVAKTLYNEMRDLEAKAEGLFADAQAATELAPGADAVIAAAQTHFDNYNFLDAVRFLEAALGM